MVLNLGVEVEDPVHPSNLFLAIFLRIWQISNNASFIHGERLRGGAELDLAQDLDDVLAVRLDTVDLMLDAGIFMLARKLPDGSCRAALTLDGEERIRYVETAGVQLARVRWSEEIEQGLEFARVHGRGHGGDEILEEGGWNLLEQK